MGSIGKISLELSNRLSSKLNKTKEEKAILNYGMFIVIHTSVGILLNLFIGIMTGMTIEIMLVAITVSLFKRYSGGVHASTPERCAIIGAAISYISALISKYTLGLFSNSMLITIIILILGISWFILYKKCPIPSKYKQFKKEKERQQIRRKAFKLLGLYALFLIILFILYNSFNTDMIYKIIFSILMGISIQMVFITSNGERIIKILDKSFDILKLNKV